MNGKLAKIIHFWVFIFVSGLCFGGSSEFEICWSDGCDFYKESYWKDNTDGGGIVLIGFDEADWKGPRLYIVLANYHGPGKYVINGGREPYDFSKSIVTYVGESVLSVWPASNRKSVVYITSDKNGLISGYYDVAVYVDTPELGNKGHFYHGRLMNISKK